VSELASAFILFLISYVDDYTTLPLSINFFSMLKSDLTTFFQLSYN